MLKEGTRYCDVCGEIIPKGETYRRATLPSEAVGMLSAPKDPDLRATFTVNPDGTVSLDRCLDCFMSMGDPDADPKH